MKRPFVLSQSACGSNKLSLLAAPMKVARLVVLTKVQSLDKFAISTMVTLMMFVGPTAPWMSEGVRLPVEVLVLQSVTSIDGCGAALAPAAGLPERGAPGRLLVRASSASPIKIRGRGTSCGRVALGATAPTGKS